MRVAKHADAFNDHLIRSVQHIVIIYYIVKRNAYSVSFDVPRMFEALENLA